MENEIDFEKFKTVFPGVSVKKLINQRHDIGTDDGCIHFMDIETKKVYSWNYLENEWEFQEKSQEELRKTLFVKEKTI
jgi:CRISPR/Cas system-associated protein endoribonuclease Cas2